MANSKLKQAHLTHSAARRKTTAVSEEANNTTAIKSTSSRSKKVQPANGNIPDDFAAELLMGLSNPKMAIDEEEKRKKRTDDFVSREIARHLNAKPRQEEELEGVY